MIEKFNKIKENGKEKYKEFRSFFKETYNKRIIYMYIVGSLFIALVIEMMARGSFIDGIFYLIKSPYIFICNSVIILMTYSFTLLTRRRIFFIGLITVIWITLGISNAVLLGNRVTPLTGVDLLLIDSALGVLNKYFSIWQIILVALAFIAVIVLLVYMYLKAPKVNHKINHIRNLFAIGLIWAIGFGTLNLGVASELIPSTFGNLRDCYNEYGFIYCFSNSLLNTGVSKPEEYSNESIKEIAKGEDKEKVKFRPNIIFIQLESFFDLNKMKGLTFSQDPTPTFNTLKEHYPSGYFSVPIIGAGTVNTEFEAMTGMNLDDFGPGEYPFKTVLTEKTCESICFNLKEYGYKCHAIHNNTATFYGRNNVFANLGYDTFTSIENMYIDEMTPMGWAKDKYLVDEILQFLKSSKKQDFVYGISVQGHGSYPSENNYDYPILIEGIEDEAERNQFQYYAWQINEMDQFVADLINAVDNLDEDSIIVFYGDHLPSLGITSDELINDDIYQTEYVIWSNFKSKYEDEDIEAYQLQSKILEKLNMTAGAINYYSQQHRNDEDKEAYREGLHSLEYDMLYGDYFAFNGKNPYERTDIKIGLRDVIVKSVTPLNDELETVYIYGENFTKYSKVYINGDKVDTNFVDKNTLSIINPELKDGDLISVYQQNSDKNVLSKTEEFEYTEEIKPSKKKKKKKN